MASLRLIPPSGTTIEIDQDQVLVGRETTCDVVLNDGSVSRKHARLEKRGRTWMVLDQGSANGTFVDSQRIAETALRTGQELRFGAMSFRVEVEGEEVIAATMLTDAPPEATVVQPMTPALPPSRPPAAPPVPVPAPPRPAAAPPPPPPPPPPPASRSAAVPPTGSLPPGSIPGRVSPAPPPPPRPASPGSRPPARLSIPASPPPEAAMAPPKKGKGPLFWIATGCCGCLLLGMVLSALIGGFAFHMTSDAVAAVRAQLADIKAGNLDAAYDRCTSEYKARVSREEFEVLVSRHAGLRENADSTFWKRSVENSRGEISGVLTSTSGTKEAVTYKLEKEGGAWKISDIEFAGQSQT